MEELPLAVQLKLQTLPGREQGEQEVDLVLDDGRVIEGVFVKDCMYVEDERFEAHFVNDVYLPEDSASPAKMVLFWVAVIGGVILMFWSLAQLRPN